VYLIPKLKKFEEQKNESKDEQNSSPPAGILPTKDEQNAVSPDQILVKDTDKM